MTAFEYNGTRGGCPPPIDELEPEAKAWLAEQREKLQQGKALIEAQLRERRYCPLDEMQCKHGADSRNCGDCLAEEAAADDYLQWGDGRHNAQLWRMGL